MENKYLTIIGSSVYDKYGLCHGIDLRIHVAGDLEEVGAFRAQEHWRRLVGTPWRNLSEVFWVRT